MQDFKKRIDSLSSCLSKSVLISVIIMLVSLPVTVFIVENFAQPTEGIEFAPHIDTWSGIHVLSGGLLFLGMFYLKVQPRHILPIVTGIGALWEVVEHLFLKYLAIMGGKESILNYTSDIVFVFLGGLIAMIILIKYAPKFLKK